MVALPPVVLLSANQRVVDVLYHVVQDSNWIGCDLAEQNLLIACLIDVDLDKRRSTFFLFSGRLRRNQTALSFIFSESPYVTKRTGSMTL